MEQRENFPPGHVRLPIGTASQRRAGAKGPPGRRFATVNTDYKQRSRAFRPAPLFIRGPIRSFPNRIEYAMSTGRHGIICTVQTANAAKQGAAHTTAQPKPALPVCLPQSGRQARVGLLLWYNNRRAVIIPSYGQGDTRARPAAARMANYTMPLRGYGIITAARSLYRLMPNGSPLTRQPPSDGQLYHAASRTWYNNFMRCARAAAIGKNSGAWSRPCVCGPSRPTRFDSGLCRQKRRRAVLLCVCIEKCREGAELVAW